MRLISSAIEPGADSGRVRLTGRVRYEDEYEDEAIWFEVPASLEKFLSLTGNVWLVLLLPLAATLGQSLSIPLEVDASLLENSGLLMKIWRGWYPKLRGVSIDAPTSSAEPQGDASLSFLSGGVDSFHTALTASPVDEVAFVWGFDIQLHNRWAFDHYWPRLQTAANRLGKNAFYVSTNLRESRLRFADWAHLYHGSALASIALALEPRYQRALISATHSLGQSMPWGSHYLTDPLSSTSALQILQYGGELTRFQKTEIVASSQPALDALRVCSHSRADYNCSECNKCYRTMISLELLGALKTSRAFDRNKFRIDRIPYIFSEDQNAASFLQELELVARERDREDIAGALRQSLDRSARLRPWLKIPRLLQRTPFMWRYASPVEKLILSRSIY